MKVFISWSGDQSRRLAETLHDWLPDVIQDLEPWVSSEDIAKGKRWNEELSRSLDDVHQRIVCVTPDNMHSPWLNFEAGALAKRLEGSTGGQVRPILLGVRPADVTGPLASFQATDATNSVDLLKLLHSLDQARTDERSKLGKQRLQRYFDMNWPTLRDRVEQLLALMAEETDKPIEPPENTERDQGDMLAELLEAVRRLERRADQPPPVRSVATLTSGPLARSSMLPFSDENRPTDLFPFSSTGYRFEDTVLPPSHNIMRDIEIAPGGRFVVERNADGGWVYRIADNQEKPEGESNQND